MVETTVCTVWAFHVEAGATQAFDVELHHLLEQISVCPVLTSSVNAIVGLVIVLFLVKVESATSTVSMNHDDILFHHRPPSAGSVTSLPET